MSHILFKESMICGSPHSQEQQEHIHLSRRFVVAMGISTMPGELTAVSRLPEKRNTQPGIISRQAGEKDSVHIGKHTHTSTKRHHCLPILVHFFMSFGNISADTNAIDVGVRII